MANLGNVGIRQRACTTPDACAVTKHFQDALWKLESLKRRLAATSISHTADLFFMMVCENRIAHFRSLAIVLGGLVSLWGASGAAAGEADTWHSIHQAARAAFESDRHELALKYASRAVVEAEILGREDSRLADSLYLKAETVRRFGRFAEADTLHQRAFDIRRRQVEPDPLSIAQSMYALGELRRQQARYKDSESFAQQALTIRESVLGPDDPLVASSLRSLAEVDRVSGRYPRAEQSLLRAIAIAERTVGPEHPDMAANLSNLANVYRTQGRLNDADELYVRALTIRERKLGPDNLDLAMNLNNLAGLYHVQGRYSKAESQYRRSLATWERTMPVDHPEAARVRNNLGLVYFAQGRYAQAEPFYKEALRTREATLGPDHPDVAYSLHNLALLYRLLGRYEDAELLLRQAVVIREKALGPESRAVASSLTNLSALYIYQGKHSEALPLTERALAIQTKVLGQTHPDVAASLIHLGSVYQAQGQLARAEESILRSVWLREQGVGPSHPQVAEALTYLAILRNSQGRSVEALSDARRATEVRRGRARLGAQTALATGVTAQSEQRSFASGYSFHVKLLETLYASGAVQHASLAAEAFEVAQLARAVDTSNAIARMAARFASGDDELAALARARQDALIRWQNADGEFIRSISGAVANRNLAQENQFREQMDGLERNIAELDAEIDRRFPEYRTLADPEPLSFGEAQGLVGPGEALISVLLGETEGFLWVLTRRQGHLFRLDITRADVDSMVRELRSQLDPVDGILKPFSVATAHRLYERLLKPAEAVLAGVTHVIVVADGALQSLPLGVLVTKRPNAHTSKDSDYRAVAWLARRFAITVLPSENSLKSLRRFDRGKPGSEPFRGFGDPEIAGRGRDRGVKAGLLFTRSGPADVEAIRELSRLPETADELFAIAKALGASPSAVSVGRQATETLVKQASLSNVRVLAFATHGLIGGEFSGVVEPALVLTPPERPTPLDDGLLTASEVAQLKLNADWVVLSACNTASADGTPGAAGLSGLAKAFFYAGSRALLVSYWSIDSSATVRLVTQMVEEAAANPAKGKAEALRRSSLALMQGRATGRFTHPAFWAPFVVVGEGNANWKKQ